jgi:hypothetical protein
MIVRIDGIGCGTVAGIVVVGVVVEFVGQSECEVSRNVIFFFKGTC